VAVRFECTILGVNSAYPVHGRHPSCQVINYNNELIMIDCGESAQIHLSNLSIKRSRINHILISHLHGDHCFGLPGLLTSFSLQGRSKKLTIHGPLNIKKYLETVLEISGSYLTYELDILEYDTSICHDFSIHKNLEVQTFPLDHRMPTMGFRLQEKQSEMNIDPSKIKEYDLSIEEIKAVKRGEDIRGLSNSKFVLPMTKNRSYAYCSDTAYDESIINYIKEVDLLYHEATYLGELEQLAIERKHTTLAQAIQIAKLSSAGKLLVGHYSSRYTDLSEFVKRGKEKLGDKFLLGQEGETYAI